MSSQLQVYKCHKIVHAEPMTWGEYADFKQFRAETRNERQADDKGFRVVYGMGTANEYVSWSPKDVFDEGYDHTQGYLTDNEMAKVHINIVQHELNENLKKVEAELLSRLDDVFSNEKIDKRCLALARTKFEEGFMWANRAYHQALISQLEGRDEE